MNRSEIREQAFKLIYSLEIQNIENLEEQIELYIESNNITDKNAIEYIKDSVLGIKKNEKDIMQKIKILFTDYNMYRNFIATFFLLLVSKFAYAVKNWLNINSTIICTILFIFLLVLFVISYKKQLGYIHSRIENTKSK